MTPTVRPRRIVACLTVIVLLVGCVGCGGASGDAAKSNSLAGRPESQARVTAQLKAAVRKTVKENFQLSLYVLWNNRIPTWATASTRGPALMALRSAAATRRKQGIQIKNLSGRYRITSITLAPSYTTATAIVTDKRHVVPYESGRRAGKAIATNDHARMQLHRLGQSTRFVVWNVSP